MGSKKIYIFTLAAAGQGISGGDRIFIEFAKNWSEKYPVTIYLWQEGYQMCLRHKLQPFDFAQGKISNVKFQISNMEPWRRFGFIVNYFARIAAGIRLGLTTKLENSKDTIVYSASEFWMDSLPAFILKLRYPKIRWVAAWYQTAPKPWVGFSEEERRDRYYFKALIYWLVQLPIKNLISNFANFVLVNNEEERKQFPKLNRLNKAVVVLGAVDVWGIKIWRKRFRKLPKIYDGVFQGRLHPQKGVLELIEIWKLVVGEKPDAKLVMIGDGPLMKSVKCKVQSAKLENNIRLTGYLFDGEEKYRIFAQSKLVLHPAFYDSGGMASAEAMAFGLPAVGFDLPAFKSYYPLGMVKIKVGDLENFASTAIRLLNNSLERIKLGKVALDMIEKSWSWDERSTEILKAITR